MAETTISWTHTVTPDGRPVPGYTFNPWIGCAKVSPACDGCSTASNTSHFRRFHMTSRPEIPDIIIERAVELWCRALKRPRHDNGDTSGARFITMGLAGINADRAIAKVPDYDAAIERFRGVLIERLKFSRDHAGELTGREGRHGPETVYFDKCLSCDYGPGETLAAAADAVGIPHSAFSWKSNVSFYDPSCVSARFGYGAREQNHYPISGGRWLITDLRGDDMRVIIKAAEGGLLPESVLKEIRIEEPSAAPAQRADGGAGIVTKHSNIAGQQP